MIPHKGAWVQIPGLIKDGVLFTLHAGHCLKSSPSYEKL